MLDAVAWAQVGTTTSITAHAAENLAAVLAAVNAIACTIASLPAYVVRADDSRAEVPDHPLQKLIDFGVNDDETWSDFVEGLLASCLLRGNALAEVSTDDRGRLRSLTTLPWRNITPYVGDDGALLFDYLPMLPPNAGRRRRLMRGDVLFVKDRSDDGVIGVSRLSRAAGALGIALDLQHNAAAFMANASRPGGYLASPTHMNDDLKTRYKQDWDAAYNSGERGKTAILAGGMTYQNLGLLTAEDAELVAQRNFSVADVARIFQVPPFMLADPSRTTFASSKESSRQFAVQALMPWVTKLQRAFAQSILSAQYRLVIDLGDLLRADPEARWASWQRARQAGVLSANEVRSEEGWPRSNDQFSDSIQPPAMGGAKPGAEGGDEAKSTPPPSEDEKIARLDQRRGGHGPA